jgi:hypothetical protein
MNGTISVRDQFKEAFGIGHGRAFVYGTTHADAHTFFRHVAAKHYKKSKTVVKFMFKRCGGNKKWNVGMLKDQLSRKGKYVFFGATRNTSDAHKKQFASLKKVAGDDEKIEVWNKSKTLVMDHAVSVVVDEKSEGKIYDNGCTSGEKIYSVLNVAERMRSITECFVLDLYCE